jgi:hypothetical protein
VSAQPGQSETQRRAKTPSTPGAVKGVETMRKQKVAVWSELSDREPAHALFAMRLSRTLATKWTHPLAFILLLSGFGLIWVRGYDLLNTMWLLVSVVIFGISFLYATFVQNRDLARTLELIEKGPPDTLEPNEQTELLKLRKRIRYGGLFMRSIVIIVLFLMVFKPF